MEDHGIAAIEKAAHDYVDARDARMRMTTEEGNRHTKLLAVMQKYAKRRYVHRNGDEMIDVEIAAKDATAKARVKIVPFDEYGKKVKRAAEEPVIEGDEPELDIDETDSDDPDDEITDDELEGDDDTDDTDDEDEDEARE